MRGRIITLCCVTCAVQALSRQPAYRWQQPEPSHAIAAFAKNHIEVGLRLSYTQLKETSRREFNEAGTFTGGFLGSIDELDVEQRNILTPILRLKWNEYFGVQLGYTSVGAKTTTFWDGHTDGSFRLSGPTIEVFARTKSFAGLSPYAALGIAPLSATFSHNELWHNGFSPSNPEPYRNWVKNGRPEWPNNGYRRTIDPSDTTASLLSGGVVYRISEQWLIDLSLRHMAADVNAKFYLSWFGDNVRDQGTYKIPMSNWSGLLAVLYDF